PAPAAPPLLAIPGSAKPPDSRAGALVVVDMQAKLRAKIESIAERHEELGEMICDPEVVADKQRFLALSREHAELSPVATTFGQLRELERQLDEARELLEDPDMRELAQDDLPVLEQALARASEELTRLLT